MTTKLTDAAKIRRIADRNEEWRFRAEYSGRGMYGRKCVGIICPAYEQEKVVRAVKRAGVKAMANRDSMAFDVIVYWPSVEPETFVDDEAMAEFGENR